MLYCKLSFTPKVSASPRPLKSQNFKLNKLQFKNPAFQRFYADVPSDKLSLTFASPFTSIFLQEPVDLVTVPAVEGDMGVAASHVPIIAELNPGVVTVTRQGKNEKYFISCGFLKVDENSNCSISCVEAVAVSELDKAAAQKGMDNQIKLLSSAKTDEKKAQHQLSIEVYQSVIRAIDNINN